ncbi:MAG: acyl-CoA dehydrogenase [Planctomycetota bacterium]|nr:MAG: acyl-CoA dehydrogenase [Planctomycetota bacterium]
MEFQLSEEQRLFQQSVREMLERYKPRRKEYIELMHKEKRFPSELWREFAHLGLTGCLIPESYGGNEAGLLSLVLGVEEIARAGFSPGLLLLTAMDTACLVRNGSEALKARILPRVASGELKLCWALTEPNAGSNAFAIETTARKEGGSYILRGQKVFITGVDLADYILLVARTTSVEELKRQGMPKVHGLSLFLVEAQAPGLEKRVLPTRGIEGMHQYHLFLDDVSVPEDHLVGEPDAGSFAMFNSLNPERIIAAAIAVGMMEFCLEVAVGYARERKVFRSTPIGAYQAISHPLARVKIQAEALRLLTYKAAWCYDQGHDPAEVGRYANMAKYFAAEAVVEAVDRGIQTLGGYGFSEEYEIIYLWEGARLFRTAPVSQEMILNFMAEHVLGLPRSY